MNKATRELTWAQLGHDSVIKGVVRGHETMLDY
jgi:hypothetical protein